MACETLDVKNLGLSRCNELPNLLNGMYETNDDFAIPAATLASGDAAVQAYLEAALLDPIADRTYMWPPFKSFENISVAPVYEDTPLSFSDVMDIKYRFRFGISENLCLHKAMYTHKRKNGRVFLRDAKGYLIGTLLSNGDFAGLKIQLLNPEGMTFNDGSVTTKSPILVALADSTELNANGYMYNAVGFINELESIVDVELTIIGTPTTSSIVVEVKTVCDSTAVSGLVVGDFNLTDDDDGASHAITTSTPHPTIAGRYTLAGTAFEDSVLNLDAPDVLSIQSYESIGGVAVTIP